MVIVAPGAVVEQRVVEVQMQLQRRAMTGLAVSLTGAVGILALLAGFVPDQGGPWMRRRISTEVVRLNPQTTPKPLARSDDIPSWQARAPMNRAGLAAGGESALTEDAGEPMRLQAGGPDADALVVFTAGSVAMRTATGVRPVQPAATGMQRLLRDAGRDDAYASMTGGADVAAANRSGRIAVVADDSNLECRPVRPSTFNATLRFLARGASLDGSAIGKAQLYRDAAERAARRFGIRPRLVLAIMHTESDFNPETISPRAAIGLMQVVASTAGGEAHAYLFGEARQPGFDELMDPERNIRYGTAYLHLLLTRHFSGVRNPQTREILAISAYNVGPYAALRVFDAERDKALAIVNELTPQDVYDRLTRELPSEEGRRYLGKVYASLASFSALR